MIGPPGPVGDGRHDRHKLPRPGVIATSVCTRAAWATCAAPRAAAAPYNARAPLGKKNKLSCLFTIIRKIPFRTNSGEGQDMMTSLGGWE